MVHGFNMINIFPELANQSHIDPFPPRQRLFVQVSVKDIDPRNTPAPYRMRITLRQLVILAIMSSPLQMLTMAAIHEIIEPMVPLKSRGTLRDSIRVAVWKCEEFENVGGHGHGKLWRWRSHSERPMIRPNYQGAEMDEILLDTKHAYSIVIENLVITKITKTNLATNESSL